MAAVETLSSADVEAFHRVCVVPDEYEAGAALLLAIFERDTNVEQATAPHRSQCRPRQCIPLAAAEPALLVIAIAHDVRIQAQARIVDEDASIDRAHVHVERVSCSDGAHRVLGVEWNAQILREMVERPQWQHPERNPGSRER